MEKKIVIQKLRPENSHSIVLWCRDKGEDFLRQWAGIGYRWPLAEACIVRRLNAGAEVFGAYIDDEMVGTIEAIERNEAENSVLVGRFLVNPELAGKGLGTAIMTEFLHYCKECLGAAAATLYVFDFNKGARRCYEKCGFEEIGRVERPNGWIAVHMKKTL